MVKPNTAIIAQTDAAAAPRTSVGFWSFIGCLKYSSMNRWLTYAAQRDAYAAFRADLCKDAIPATDNRHLGHWHAVGNRMDQAGIATPSCSQVLATSVTVARCMSRTQRKSS